MTKDEEIRLLRGQNRLLDTMLKIAIETTIQSRRDGDISTTTYNNTRKLLEDLANSAIKKEDGK
jgi:hypothetical protein